MARLLVGRYDLEEVISRGGMGEVWRATDQTLGRVVAVKILELDEDAIPGAAARFQREAQLAASLVHHNIVTVFDFGVDGSTAFMVMEILDGPTLAERLVGGPFSIDETLAIALQIAEALQVAHAAGVIHRDITPANIQFSGPHQVKVLDFGIAQLTAATTTVATTVTSVVGTARYLSPEQALGRPVDGRSDLYAFGCVLFAMVTGKPPFDGTSALSIGVQHVDATPPRANFLRSDLPIALDALIAQLLEKDPNDRPQGAEEVRERLGAIPRPSLEATSVFPTVSDATVAIARTDDPDATVAIARTDDPDATVAMPLGVLDADLTVVSRSAGPGAAETTVLGAAVTAPSVAVDADTSPGYPVVPGRGRRIPPPVLAGAILLLLAIVAAIVVLVLRSPGTAKPPNTTTTGPTTTTLPTTTTTLPTTTTTLPTTTTTGLTTTTTLPTTTTTGLTTTTTLPTTTTTTPPTTTTLPTTTTTTPPTTTTLLPTTTTPPPTTTTLSGATTTT